MDLLNWIDDNSLSNDTIRVKDLEDYINKRVCINCTHVYKVGDDYVCNQDIIYDVDKPEIQSCKQIDIKE